MSSNSSTINDPDFDESSDWIELYNSSGQTIDLSGYFLTDNFGEPTKWVFPQSTFIDAESYLIIWADGENTGLHASYRLGKAGEELGLYNQDTVRMDSVVFGYQKTDVSMGRKQDAATALGFFEVPTPGAANTGALSGLTFYQPKFSIKGGFYSNPISVELSSIDGEIRYTLDGSTPTTSSTLYTAPLTINETTILRAGIFESDFVAGPSVTHTYFYDATLADRKLPVFSIVGNPEYFWDADIGLYVQDFKPDWEYPINIEFFENDGSDRAVVNERAGTKVNGQNSWVLPQKMLGIYFDNEYGNNNIEYPLFHDRSRRKFGEFILRASGSDWSSTLFRDGLTQGLTAENMNVPISGFRPSIAFINGQYMGIHNLRSRINEGYIEENFGQAGRAFDLISNNGEVEEGDAVDYAAYYALFDADLSQDANFQAVESVLDLDNFTDYWITEIYSSNSSWGHNILLWKSKDIGSKWRYILQDTDRGFTGVSDDLMAEFTTSNNPNSYNWARKPLREMLTNEDYADRFVQRFCDHLYTTFHPERVRGEIAKRADNIRTEVPNHVGRWAGTTSNYGDGLPSVAFWEDEVEELNTFADARPANILEDLKDEFNLSDPAFLGISHEPAEGGHVEINTIPIPATPWVGSYLQDIPFTLEAKPALGYTFLGWRTANNETLIQKESDWKYLDNGSDQGTAWQAVGFDDGGWTVGQAELGYGDGDENTAISYGTNNNNKHITTYFRKEFQIQNADDYTGQLGLQLRRDDGAVVYLNGVEIVRSNMPTGTIDYDTEANNTVGGTAEETFFSFNVQSNALRTGKNIIAVEVHQGSSSSSDVSFDLALDAQSIGQSNIFSLDSVLSMELDSDMSLIAQFEQVSNCILPRTITENTTLTTACSPYWVPTNVEVLPNVALTVEAGVELHFEANASLRVKGTLDVQGTQAAPVYFKSANTDAYWGAVVFEQSTGVSQLDWLDISGATNGIHPLYENAAISAFYSEISLDHLTIEDVENNPILAYYSDVRLTNSTLHSKVTGDLINVKYGDGYIENCDFRGNSQPDTDAIDYDEVENGIIRGSKIYNFLGFNSDGIDLGEESIGVLLEDNFIHNCTDKGVSVGQNSTILARNNTIVNCSQGFGVKDIAFAEVDQVTFYNVATPVASFQKNPGIGGGNIVVTNSIISNTSLVENFKDSVSILEISNSWSDTEFLPGMDNYLGNPLFVNPSQNNFELQSNSPARGLGVDDMGNPIDLGTKFHDYTAEASIAIDLIHYNPADNGEKEYIMLHNPSGQTIDLTGYMLSGAVDFVFPAATIAPNERIIVAFYAGFFAGASEQVFQWDLGRLSNGGETIRLWDANGIIVDRVRYDDELPWPLDADGQGAWLRLNNADLDNHFGESWIAEGFVHTQGLEEATMQITAYPNPVQDILNIKTTETVIDNIELLNLLGQTVFSQKGMNSNTATLHIGALDAGLYFMRINGVLVTEKILKVKG